MAKVAFFFYGTLMDESVRRAVLADRAPKMVEPAVLTGWRRFKAVGASFPIVTQAARGRVHGVLAYDVSDAARALLDAYEGPDGYIAKRLSIELQNQTRVTAMVYVPDGSNVVRPSDEPWDLAEWQAKHRRGFLARLLDAKFAQGV